MECRAVNDNRDGGEEADIFGINSDIPEGGRFPPELALNFTDPFVILRPAFRVVNHYIG
jgi:hypothetical protein